MTSTASHQVKCDNCKATLGEHYPKGRKSVSIGLHMGEDSYGNADYKTHDFCDEDCLREHLVSRTKHAKASSLNVKSRLLTLDVTQSPAFKKPAAEKVD